MSAAKNTVLQALENSPLPTQEQSDLCDEAGRIRFCNLDGAPNCPHEAFRAGWFACLAVQAGLAAEGVISKATGSAKRHLDDAAQSCHDAVAALIEASAEVRFGKHLDYDGLQHVLKAARATLTRIAQAQACLKSHEGEHHD